MAQRTQAQLREAQRIRDTDRIFNYNNARRSYYFRQYPLFIIMALGLLTVPALGYIGLQIWAYTVTGRIYMNYLLPPVCIVGLYFLLSVTIGKFCRPIEEY